MGYNKLIVSIDSELDTTWTSWGRVGEYHGTHGLRIDVFYGHTQF